MFLSRNKKKISEFLSENFQFMVVKFSIYLNRCVFVMVFSLKTGGKSTRAAFRSAK